MRDILLSHMTLPGAIYANCIEAAHMGPAFWWLGQPFGRLYFTLAFVTWGLVIIWLVLSILLMIRRLSARGKK